MHETPVKHKYQIGDTVWLTEWVACPAGLPRAGSWWLRVASEPVTVASLLPHIDAEGQYCEYYVEPSAGYDPLSEDQVFATRELAQAECDKRNKEAPSDEATD